MGGGVSTEFQSSSRIELSQLIQDLFNCYKFGCNLMGWVAGWVELVGVKTKNKNLQKELNSLISFQIIEFLVI